MLYHLLRPIAAATFRLYFREIYLSGKANIPADGAVIFASNHPTAFLEPCLLACFQSRRLHFMVRGDIFENKFYALLLRNIGMIPIYRFVDGMENMKRNDLHLEECREVLANQGALHILVEGRTRQIKHLERLQKGAARLAFDMARTTSIQIVPTGINFTVPTKMRQSVMISFGKPINLEEYRHLQDEHPQKAYRKLTQDLEDSLRSELVHIYPKEDEPWLETLLSISRNDHIKHSFSKVYNQSNALKREQAIVSYVAGLSADNKQKLRDKCLAYQQELAKQNTDDLAIADAGFPGIYNYVLLILGSPVFILGTLLNGLPFLTTYLYMRPKNYQLEFREPIRFALMGLSYFVYLIAILIILLFASGWKALLYIGVMLITGLFSIAYRDLLLRFVNKRRLSRLGFVKLEKLRKELTMNDNW